MSFSEAAFSVGLTLFGTGLYFIFETKNKGTKKRLGIVLIFIGMSGMAASLHKRFSDKAIAAVHSPSYVQTQQNTVNGNGNNTGNQSQSGSNNNAVIGNNNKVGNTYNMAPQNSGWLRPGHEPTPITSCKIDDTKKVLIVFFGNTVGWMDKDLPSPWTMLRIAGHPVLSLSTNKKGEIAINGEVYNPQDDAVVVIENNKFTTSSEAFIVNSTPTSLRVTVKHLNEPVLSVRYMNPSTVQIAGHFHYRGKDVLVTTDELIVNGSMHIGGPQCVGYALTLFEVGPH
jgi:hypothetical protein